MNQPRQIDEGTLRKRAMIELERRTEEKRLAKLKAAIQEKLKGMEQAAQPSPEF